MNVHECKRAISELGISFNLLESPQVVSRTDLPLGCSVRESWVQGTKEAIMFFNSINPAPGGYINNGDVERIRQHIRQHGPPTRRDLAAVCKKVKYSRVRRGGCPDNYTMVIDEKICR